MHILLLVHENFWRICVSFFVSKEIFGKTSEAKLIPKQNLSKNSLTSPAMKAQPLSSEIVLRGYYVIWTNTHLKALCCASTVLLLLLTHNPPESPELSRCGNSVQIFTDVLIRVETLFDRLHFHIPPATFGLECLHRVSQRAKWKRKHINDLLWLLV